MALNGTIVKDFGPASKYRIYINWSATQDVGLNKSYVTAIMYLQSLGSTYNINASATKFGSIMIDGSWYDISANVTLSGNQTKELGRATKTIDHGADGKRWFSIDGHFDINVTLSGTP